MMKYTMQKHLEYSVWANTKLAQIIEKADEDILRREVKSSFPSLEKTILHIMDAEFIWLRRLQGESLMNWPSQGFNGDRAELLQAWVAQSKALSDFVGSKGEGYLQTVVEYKNMKGDTFSNTVEELLYHVVNHGTFHRGQIVTILRELGYEDLSSTDLITYLRAVTV
jgi:uncharacterized damage-inducible protein DinB